MTEQWSRLQFALTTYFTDDVTFKEGIENPDNINSPPINISVDCLIRAV